MSKQNKTIKDRFYAADIARNAVVQRNRLHAELTIPSVLPPEGFTEHMDLCIPYQSLGARGVNNISSMLMTAVMPAGDPFFRLDVDPEALPPGRELSAQPEQMLRDMENRIHDKIWQSNIRLGINTAIQHLVVVGNALVYLSPDYNLRVYRLDEYIVRRSPDGTIFEIITRDWVDVLALSQEVLTRCNIEVAKLDLANNPKARYVELYTRTYKGNTDESWLIDQEINEILLSDKPVKREVNPFIPLRWNAIAGENYGRGHVEDYIGDLRTYEALQKAMTEGAAIMSRLLVLVRPDSPYTKISDIANSENGDVKPGREEDVHMLQTDKARDMSVAFQHAMEIEKRLGFAFMLNSAIQPTGERVTATQIRTLVRELESTLGGIFSILAQELQLPLVKVVMDQMIDDGSIQLPKAEKKILKPVILAGLEALGREQDLVRIETLAQVLATLGPESLQYLNTGEFIRRAAIALNIPQEGLVRSEQEVAMMRAQQAQMDVASNIASNVDPNAQAQPEGPSNGQPQPG